MEAIDLYGLNFYSISLRLLMAVIISGVIGLERGAHKHPAGFRTHILVCVGATLAMLTNQYMYDTFGSMVDPGRLGAQVITGVGFLGVGTILVTGRYKIRGLTTAAGLWASACIGLAIGIGFYMGAILAGLLVFISLGLLPKIEDAFYAHARALNVYAQIETFHNLKILMHDIKAMDITILETHLMDHDSRADGPASVNLILKLPKATNHKEALDKINEIPYVIIAEDIG